MALDALNGATWHNPAKLRVVVDIAAGLSARERVALFCVARGIEYPAVGMVAMMRAMRSRGLIVREGAPNRYALTEVGRDVFKLILEQSGFGATG